MKYLLLAATPGLLAVVASYAGLGPRLFLKREGRLHLLSRLLFWPYLLPNWLVWEVLRRRAGEEPCVEVMPGLWLGRRLTGREARPFRAVLDLTCEFSEPEALRRAPAYLCVPVLDGCAPSRIALETALEFIARHHREAEVYVHCAMGHGRSATVVIAHLLATGAEADVSAAERRLAALRPRVRLRRRQRRLLERLQARG